MDPNVVSLVSIVAGSTVGLGGLGVSVFSGRADRRNAGRLAHADRLMVRRADAYVALLELVNEGGDWAQAILPIIDTNPPRPDPEFPSRERQLATRARVAAFGSSAVQAGLARWDETLREVDRQVFEVRFRRQYRKDNPPIPGQPIPEAERELYNHTAPWIELQEVARPAEVQARKDLEGLVNAEMSTSPSLIQSSNPEDSRRT